MKWYAVLTNVHMDWSLIKLGELMTITLFNKHFVPLPRNSSTNQACVHTAGQATVMVTVGHICLVLTSGGYSSLSCIQMHDQRFSKCIIIRICYFEEKRLKAILTPN